MIFHLRGHACRGAIPVEWCDREPASHITAPVFALGHTSAWSNPERTITVGLQTTGTLAFNDCVQPLFQEMNSNRGENQEVDHSGGRPGSRLYLLRVTETGEGGGWGQTIRGFPPGGDVGKLIEVTLIARIIPA